MRRAPSGAWSESPTPAIFRSPPMRMSVASCGTPLPKPTGITREINKGDASSWEVMRSEILSQARIEKIPEAVADHLKGKNGQDDRDAGKQRHPVGLSDILPPGRDHRSPGRHLGTDSEAQEGQSGFRQHGIGEDEGA